MYDSEFKVNYSDWDGGAVYLNAGGMKNDSIPAHFYRCTFDGNRAGEDGGAIYSSCGMSVLTKAKTYGCDFINNVAGKYGGAVSMGMDCSFEFYSDNETGKAGTIKNNTAGELGGGVYQGSRGGIDLGGEIYASGNVSSVGDDDIYILSGGYIDIFAVTSPEGSIGIRYKNDKGCRLTDINDANKDVNPKVFFVNNEGLEVVRSEYRYSNMDDTMIPCLSIAKKAPAVGSIFGEGSLPTVISLLALVASIASVGVCVSLHKKMTVPATANKAEETEDKE